MFAWGSSEDRQLGLDTEEDVPFPKVVESLLGIRFRGRDFGKSPLIGGSRNTLAIDADGQLWSWGWNDRGTLGQGHRGPERKPKQVAALKGTCVVQAAIGGWHCLALTDQGQLFSWGGNEYQQCGVEPEKRDIVSPLPCLSHLRVVQVACGGMHSLILTDMGQMWTWGEPWGDFSLNIERHPRKVPQLVDMAAIACGAFHNMALSSEGDVYTWGTNDYGQLGNGGTSYQTVPHKVVDLDHVRVADVGAGGWHSFALTEHGEVYTWGRGEYGRLGSGDHSGSSKLRPHRVKGLEQHRVVQAAAGGTHTLALTSSGRMFTWGRGSYGRLGLGHLRDYYHPVECVLPGGHERWRVIAITCGGRHSMCLAMPMREGQEVGQVEEEGQKMREALSLAARRVSSPLKATQRADTDDLEGASMATAFPAVTRVVGSMGGMEMPSVDGAGMDEDEEDHEARETRAPGVPMSQAASMDNGVPVVSDNGGGLEGTIITSASGTLDNDGPGGEGGGSPPSFSYHVPSGGAMCPTMYTDHYQRHGNAHLG